MNPIAEVVISPLSVPLEAAVWLAYAGGVVFMTLCQGVMLGMARSGLRAWLTAHVVSMGVTTLWLGLQPAPAIGAAMTTLLVTFTGMWFAQHIWLAPHPATHPLVVTAGLLGVISLALAWWTPSSAPELWVTACVASALSLVMNTAALALNPHPSSAKDATSTHMRELQKAQEALKLAQAELASQNTKDPLTGLHNRTFLTERMPEIWGVAVRWKQHLAMLMVDIDHLDAINARYSRAAGDEVLKAVAEVITQNIRRPSDHALRYGDEEFLVVLPQTHAAGAAHMAERIRAAVASLTLTHGGKKIDVTVSIGVACATPSPRTEMALMLQLADRLLYQAKSEGRNRCALQPSALAQLKLTELG